MSSRQRSASGGRAGLLAIVTAGLLLAGMSALGAGAGLVPSPTPGGARAAAAAATAGLDATAADPVGTFPADYSGTIPEAPSPVPGVTPSPEPDPGHLHIPGVTLAGSSTLAIDAVRLGSATVDPGYTQVSFHLHLTLGADFATRLDRSIHLWGPDDIRYLADEPAVGPSLLAETGADLDGWVTFLLPDGLRGPAAIHVTIDPGALTEIVVPVIIGDGVAQPGGTFAPGSVLDEPSPDLGATATPSADSSGVGQ